MSWCSPHFTTYFRTSCSLACRRHTHTHIFIFKFRRNSTRALRCSSSWWRTPIKPPTHYQRRRGVRCHCSYRSGTTSSQIYAFLLERTKETQHTHTRVVVLIVKIIIIIKMLLCVSHWWWCHSSFMQSRYDDQLSWKRNCRYQKNIDRHPAVEKAITNVNYTRIEWEWSWTPSDRFYDQRSARDEGLLGGGASISSVSITKRISFRFTRWLDSDPQLSEEGQGQSSTRVWSLLRWITLSNRFQNKNRSRQRIKDTHPKHTHPE